jgi:hypothetical protein
MMTNTIRRFSRAAVHSPWIVYIADPSPISATTGRSGSASFTPIAAGRPQPMPPPRMPKKLCGSSLFRNRRKPGAGGHRLIDHHRIRPAARGRSRASAPEDGSDAVPPAPRRSRQPREAADPLRPRMRQPPPPPGLHRGPSGQHRLRSSPAASPSARRGSKPPPDSSSPSSHGLVSRCTTGIPFRHRLDIVRQRQA